MLLVLIILLLSVLTFLWYFIIRDVDLEGFPDEMNTVTLKYKDQYLVGQKHQCLTLGPDDELATYIVHNYDEGDHIQLESYKYPGYYVCLQGDKFYLKSKYNLKNLKTTLLVPIAYRDKDGILSFQNENGFLGVSHNKIKIVKRHPSKSHKLTYQKGGSNTPY